MLNQSSILCFFLMSTHANSSFNPVSRLHDDVDLSNKFSTMLKSPVMIHRQFARKDWNISFHMAHLLLAMLDVLMLIQQLLSFADLSPSFVPDLTHSFSFLFYLPQPNLINLRAILHFPTLALLVIASTSPIWISPLHYSHHLPPMSSSQFDLYFLHTTCIFHSHCISPSHHRPMYSQFNVFVPLKP